MEFEIGHLWIIDIKYAIIWGIRCLTKKSSYMASMATWILPRKKHTNDSMQDESVQQNQVNKMKCIILVFNQFSFLVLLISFAFEFEPVLLALFSLYLSVVSFLLLSCFTASHNHIFDLFHPSTKVVGCFFACIHTQRQ